MNLLILLKSSEVVGFDDSTNNIVLMMIINQSRLWNNLIHWKTIMKLLFPLLKAKWSPFLTSPNRILIEQ